jgi:type IV secretory pathway VirB2 component (pilin)
MRDLNVTEIEQVTGGMAETLAIVYVVALFLKFLRS